jgi:dihydrofolate synthase / folylpolyglutamate synthase
VSAWTYEQAESHLLGLELFGMRFGLDRMRRLLVALGSPQLRFRSVHVVGTNGKSSTVRMCAALLDAHGVRAGSYLSPHLGSFAERVRVGDADVSGEEFAAAVQRAAVAAEKVDRTAAEDDRVTQFELLTAAAFDELARQEVEVAVVEAGLGGRHDATNVLDAEVAVLTNVGLEHTRWLGPTVLDIAREKLAVVPAGATLVLGDADPDVVALARATGARLVSPERPDVELPGFQRHNFGAACAAARAVLGTLDDGVTASVARRVQVPGRLQVIGDRPLTILDGAHNPSGMAALAAALPERPFTAVVSILDDKDAGAMLAALRGRSDRFVCTAAPTPRALPPATLASLAQQLGAEAEVVPEPHAALARARTVAGPDGAVIATGSIYLIADLVSGGRRKASAL